MRFVKTPTPQPAAEYLAGTINNALQKGKRVLWLVSGGSAVEIAVSAARLLSSTNVRNLTISLADERFGPVGHAESIWQQLKDADFNVLGAKLLPVLTGQEFKATANAWEENMQGAFNTNDYKIALLGMGPDGHTAGILPHSPASSYDGGQLVFAYQSQAIPGVRPAFARITLTGNALARLDEAVVVVMGEAKRQALESLKRELPVAEQPAQFAKQIPKVTIFNNQIGETL